MSLEHLWAGWRSAYVSSRPETTQNTHQCVFCGLLASNEDPRETNIVWRNELTAAILNAYPYGTGHILIMPVRHIAHLHELTEHESMELWRATNDATEAIRAAYHPDGMNIGFNLGEGSGAGVPGHLHAHAMPRWVADTNFITTVANTKVLPEALDVTWAKLNSSWPTPRPGSK